MMFLSMGISYGPSLVLILSLASLIPLEVSSARFPWMSSTIVPAADLHNNDDDMNPTRRVVSRWNTSTTVPSASQKSLLRIEHAGFFPPWVSSDRNTRQRTTSPPPISEKSCPLAGSAPQGRRGTKPCPNATLAENAESKNIPPLQTSKEINSHTNDFIRDRGKILGDPVNAKELYETYEAVKNDYEAKAFGKQVPWKILHDNLEERVQVAVLEHPKDLMCPYVRLKTIIPVPIQQCWDFLQVSNWHNSMPKMDPFYEGHSVHGNYRFNRMRMILCRKRTKRILAFGKRDWLFLSVTDDGDIPGQSRVAGTVSVRTKRIPRQSGYVRAYQDSISWYRPIQLILPNTTKTITPANKWKDNARRLSAETDQATIQDFEPQQEIVDATDLTIVVRLDLNDSAPDDNDAVGGFIPMWLYIKLIGRTGARSIQAMRRFLIEQHAQQQQPKSLQD